MASISIVNLSEVKQNGWRLDAEYWAGEYVENCKAIKKHKFDFLQNLSSFNARYSQPIYDENSNIKIINSQYLREDCIDYSNARNGKNKLVPHEAVMINSTGVGTLGRVNINYLKQSISVDSHVNIIVTNGVNPYFLRTFLQSKYGKYQIERSISGSSGQIEIYPKDFAQFIIPLLSPTFQARIEEAVKTAHRLLEASKTAYKTAEKLLLDEVFGSWKPRTHKNSYVKMLSQVQSAGRMDAEYFHPKYEDLITQIKGYKHGWCELGGVISIAKGIEPGVSKYKESGIPFVRVADLSKLGVRGDSKFVSQEFFADSQKLQLQQGEILLSKDGTPGIAYYLAENPKEMLCSSGIIRLSIIKNFLPEVLTLLINSNVVQPQIEQEMNGAVIKHWLVNQVSSTILPIIPQPLQTEIATLVKHSFDDRRQSKALLELAKTAVEKAIEEGEEAGIKEINTIEMQICPPN